MSEDFLSLIYTSHAVDSMQQDEIIHLLEVCERNNSQNGISGMLLFDGKRTFIQVLEGETHTVENLYEKIKVDPRHTNVTSLGRRGIPKREFADWRMGFRTMDKANTAKLKGYSNFMEQHDPVAYLEANPSYALQMLYFFRDRTLGHSEPEAH